MLAYYMNSAELQHWISTLRHPGNDGNYEMFTQQLTIGEDYMKDMYYAANSERNIDFRGGVEREGGGGGGGTRR